MPTQIVFETHSWSEDNERGIATGWLPGRLSERGRSAAAELGRRRRDDRIAAVFTSDLRRAVQTAEIAFAGTELPILHDWRLRECNYGSRNGTPSSSPSGTPPSCRVTYRDSAQWTGGFVAELAVANTGPAPISGWALTFRFGGDQTITSAWNATYSQAGADVTLGNLDWNRVIAPGAETSLGMQGRWTTSNAPPPAVALNGVACALQ